jgi:hypothetical protein
MRVDSIIEVLADSNGCTLHTLDISHNSLGSYPLRSNISCLIVKSLSGLLAHNTSLQKLNLSSNHFGPEDIPILSEGLNVNHTLLDLEFNENASVLNSKGFLEEKNPIREPSSENPLERPPLWLSSETSELHEGFYSYSCQFELKFNLMPISNWLFVHANLK